MTISDYVALETPDVLEEINVNRAWGATPEEQHTYARNRYEAGAR